jgi:DNA-directed RNA polymerase specialized sigma24 family protein
LERIKNFGKLNTLVDTYRATKDQAVFAEIYAEVDEERRTNKRLVLRSGLGDENDADSIFDERLFKLISRDDVIDFGKLLSTALKNARLSFYRAEKRRRAHYILAPKSNSDDDGDEAPTSHLIADELDMEHEAVERLDKKKEDQQRQLLVSIHESARIPFDSEMVRAIKELQRLEQRFSIEALAKALGIQRNTLARKLERLGRAYDRNVHGEITDYIPTYLRIKRSYLAS